MAISDSFDSLDCSCFPHEESKTLIITPEPFDAHKTCANPPPRTVRLMRFLHA